MLDIKKHMDLTNEERKNLADIQQYEKVNWYIEGCKLKAGQGFGELAILNMEARSATVQCITRCYFATLDKQAYTKVLRQIELRTMDKRIEWIRSLPCMAYFSNLQVKKNLQ